MSLARWAVQGPVTKRQGEGAGGRWPACASGTSGGFVGLRVPSLCSSVRLCRGVCVACFPAVF